MTVLAGPLSQAPGLAAPLLAPSYVGVSLEMRSRSQKNLAMHLA
jgi:hypothetical protein